jgi:hypothetical protein
MSHEVPVVVTEGSEHVKVQRDLIADRLCVVHDARRNA